MYKRRIWYAGLITAVLSIGLVGMWIVDIRSQRIAFGEEWRIQYYVSASDDGWQFATDTTRFCLNYSPALQAGIRMGYHLLPPDIRTIWEWIQHATS